jgi:exodeoxyribonuclease VII large subunit
LRLRELIGNRLETAEERLDSLTLSRVFRQPVERIRERERRLDELDQRLRRALERHMQTARQSIEKRAAQLASLSPLNVLARGYSLTRTLPDLHVVRGVGQLKRDDRIEVRFHEGQVIARVDELKAAVEERHA